MKKEVKALVNGKDRAGVLREMGIDIEHHGNFDPEGPARLQGPSGPARPNQFLNLSAADLEHLARLGLTSRQPGGWPRWTVAITWHWTQTFPAGKVIRVRHEYTPAVGFRYDTDVPRFLDGLPDACADQVLVRALEARKTAAQEAARRNKTKLHSMAFGHWVKYTLTTANGWKGPIADFELVVERPADHFVSFCWDGKVEKVNATTFRAGVRNFAPKKELTVYFFSVR